MHKDEKNNVLVLESTLILLALFTSLHIFSVINYFFFKSLKSSGTFTVADPKTNTLLTLIDQLGYNSACVLALLLPPAVKEGRLYIDETSGWILL